MTYDQPISQDLIEVLYLISNRASKAMMPKYEFIEIEGLLFLDLFHRSHKARTGLTDGLGPPVGRLRSRRRECVAHSQTAATA